MTTMTDLKLLTPAKMLDLFNKAASSNGAGLEEQARIWVVYKEVTKQEIPWAEDQTRWFPQMADGKLRGALLLALGTSNNLIARLAKLVPEDQDKILKARGEVEVKTGPKTVVKKRITQLSAVQFEQVFAGDKLLHPVQQKLLPPEKPYTPPETSSLPRVRIGEKWVLLAHLKQTALDSIFGRKRNVPTQVFQNPMTATAEEQKALEAAAKAKGVTVGIFLLELARFNGVVE